MEERKKGKKAVGSHRDERLERSPGGRSKKWQHRRVRDFISRSLVFRIEEQRVQEEARRTE